MLPRYRSPRGPALATGGAYHRHVLGPSRPLPRVGAPARIARFGGSFEHATVVAVEDEGRLLRVRSEGGELLEFALNRASARFLQAGIVNGPRLELLGD
jgi:hypothetical protein